MQDDNQETAHGRSENLATADTLQQRVVAHMGVHIGVMHLVVGSHVAADLSDSDAAAAAHASDAPHIEPLTLCPPFSHHRDYHRSSSTCAGRIDGHDTLGC